jgi:hypothetical protein
LTCVQKSFRWNWQLLSKYTDWKDIVANPMLGWDFSVLSHRKPGPSPDFIKATVRTLCEQTPPLIVLV